MPGNRRYPSIFPVIIMVLGAVLIIVAVVVFTGIAVPPEPSKQTESEFSGPHPEISRISAADAKIAFDSGEAVFVDVRGEPYYSEGHIPGALSIEENKILIRVNELNPDDWIITYCT
jgi:3-mercaptopyruvate sulfurtransferase SseA